MYSDILGQSGLDYKKGSPNRGSIPVDQGEVRTRSGTQNHNAKGVKFDNLKSSLDNHSYEPMIQNVQVEEAPEKIDFKTIPGK